MSILPGHIYRLLRMGSVKICQQGQPLPQDNAQIHATKMTKEWYESNGIWVIDWPSCSPNLNPIEYV